MVYALRNELKVVEKAQKSKNMFNFYHILALMTSSTYQGYVTTEEEKKAMEDYKNTQSEYDKHSIGGFFKLCKENDDVVRTAGNFYGYNLAFKPSELAVGFCTMFVLIGLVVLGITYC